MSYTVLSKAYTEPEFCEKEILRYAGCKKTNQEITALLKECIDEIRTRLVYRVCYCKLPVIINGDICNFDAFCVSSKGLAKNLDGCRYVTLFAATVGVEIDRLITKYSRLSPSKALMLQAIGAERIEALCNTFCDGIAKEQNVRLVPRFSPGYSDLPLETQKVIFDILDCSKRIGLTLNSSLMMSPSKSVTAFIGQKQI